MAVVRQPERDDDEVRREGPSYPRLLLFHHSYILPIVIITAGDQARGNESIQFADRAVMGEPSSSCAKPAPTSTTIRQSTRIGRVRPFSSTPAVRRVTSPAPCLRTPPTPSPTATVQPAQRKGHPVCFVCNAAVTTSHCLRSVDWPNLDRTSRYLEYDPSPPAEVSSSARRWPARGRHRSLRHTERYSPRLALQARRRTRQALSSCHMPARHRPPTDMNEI